MNSGLRSSRRRKRRTARPIDGGGGRRPRGRTPLSVQLQPGWQQSSSEAPRGRCENSWLPPRHSGNSASAKRRGSSRRERASATPGSHRLAEASGCPHRSRPELWTQVEELVATKLPRVTTWQCNTWWTCGIWRSARAQKLTFPGVWLRFAKRIRANRHLSDGCKTKGSAHDAAKSFSQTGCCRSPGKAQPRGSSGRSASVARQTRGTALRSGRMQSNLSFRRLNRMNEESKLELTWIHQRTAGTQAWSQIRSFRQGQ